MRQGRLNDAALALGSILNEHGITFGILGGAALGILGGPRASKDLDVIVVAIDKNTLVKLLNNKKGFSHTGNVRPDAAVFLWNDKKDSDTVLVELFVGVRQNQIRAPLQRQVQGERLGTGVTNLLDPAYIFKGKVRAAAERNKHSDAADIVWLEDKFLPTLKQHVNEYNVKLCGLALKKHSQLYHPFQRIGIDIKAAQSAAEGVTVPPVGLTPHYAVVKGILG